MYFAAITAGENMPNFALFPPIDNVDRGETTFPLVETIVKLLPNEKRMATRVINSRMDVIFRIS